jgi:N utilization substance protein B
VDEETRGFAEDLHRVASARQAEIDGIIEAHSQNWRIERMPVVDRNLLRTAIAEMLEYPNTPAAIVINESLEVAKRYAAPESIHFLNGVLDAVARDLLKKRLG